MPGDIQCNPVRSERFYVQQGAVRQNGLTQVDPILPLTARDHVVYGGEGEALMIDATMKHDEQDIFAIFDNFILHEASQKCSGPDIRRVGPGRNHTNIRLGHPEAIGNPCAAGITSHATLPPSPIVKIMNRFLEAVLEIRKTIALARNMGQAARARYERLFSGPALGKAYADLFREMA